MHSRHVHYICSGCANARGVCNWRGELFCGACTGALVRLQRDLNEIPLALWENVQFGSWALEDGQTLGDPNIHPRERAIVEEWSRS